LQTRRSSEFNENFHNRLDEIEEALDTPGARVELILAFLGQNLGQHAINGLSALMPCRPPAPSLEAIAQAVGGSFCRGDSPFHVSQGGEVPKESTSVVGHGGPTLLGLRLSRAV
jgi:hypothetical protein